MRFYAAGFELNVVAGDDQANGLCQVCGKRSSTYFGCCGYVGDSVSRIVGTHICKAHCAVSPATQLACSFDGSQVEEGRNVLALELTPQPAAAAAIFRRHRGCVFALLRLKGMDGTHEGREGAVSRGTGTQQWQACVDV